MREIDIFQLIIENEKIFILQDKRSSNFGAIEKTKQNWWAKQASPIYSQNKKAPLSNVTNGVCFLPKESNIATIFFVANNMRPDFGGIV